MGAPGAKCYLVWRQAQAQALTPQVFAAVVQALEALNVAGRSHARWQAKCAAFQHVAAAPGAPRDAYLVSLTGDARKDAPGYVVLRTERQVVEAEASIFEIFDKTGLYRPRAVLSFDGFVYAVGDFALRLARVSAGQARVLGIVLELEYRPVTSAALAQQPLAEVMTSVQRATAGLAGSFAAVVAPAWADYGLPEDEYSGRHSALSLVHVIMALNTRAKDASAPGPQAPAVPA